MRKLEEILTILRSELLQGRYAPGARFMSERQLMDRFDAARLTINKVTEQLAVEGFLVRGRRGSGTRVSDMLPFPTGHLAYVGSIESVYSARIIYGCQHAALMRGYALTTLLPPVDQLNYWLKRLTTGRYQGLLVSAIGLIQEEYPLPLVYLDNSLPKNCSPAASVTCDNYQGAYDMARAVLERGHSNVLICTAMTGTEYSRRYRLEGFCRAMKEAHIASPEARIMQMTGNLMAVSDQVLKNLLQRYPDTTAIFTDSDDVAFPLWLSALRVAPERNLCITGFGNLPFVGELLPTVEQHPVSIGEQGAGILIDMIERPGKIPLQETRIPTKILNLDKIPSLK